VSEHISRRELKQDKIHDAIEHWRRSVLPAQTNHAGRSAGSAGWRDCVWLLDRLPRSPDSRGHRGTQCRDKAYSGRIGTSAPDPQDPSEISYKDEAARSTDALNKFNAVANKYPSTLPGKQARYYAALCLEDLEHQNQALEDLKKLAAGGTKSWPAWPNIKYGRDLFAHRQAR